MECWLAGWAAARHRTLHCAWQQGQLGTGPACGALNIGYSSNPSEQGRWLLSREKSAGLSIPCQASQPTLYNVCFGVLTWVSVTSAILLTTLLSGA